MNFGGAQLDNGLKLLSGVAIVLLAVGLGRVLDFV